MRASSISSSSKAPTFLRYSARIFSMISSRSACHEPEAQQLTHLALAPPDLGRVERVLAQDLGAEFSRCKWKDDDPDQGQQKMRHVRGAEAPGAHALAQERADAAEDAPDRALRGLLLR